MDFKVTYPEYLAVERHIRRAGIERVTVLADAITAILLAGWYAIQQPPAPAAILIDRRKESRGEASRSFGRFAHR